MKRFFRILIKAYSYIISPFLGQNCRYYPTCSSYADQAIEQHGVLKGLVLSLLRILRCHPWSKHPFNDPVPKRFAWKDLLRYNHPSKSEKTSNDS